MSSLHPILFGAQFHLLHFVFITFYIVYCIFVDIGINWSLEHEYSPTA